jgi:hypothetical protein
MCQELSLENNCRTQHDRMNSPGPKRDPKKGGKIGLTTADIHISFTSIRRSCKRDSFCSGYNQALFDTFFFSKKTEITIRLKEFGTDFPRLICTMVRVQLKKASAYMFILMESEKFPALN